MAAVLPFLEDRENEEEESLDVAGYDHAFGGLGGSGGICKLHNKPKDQPPPEGCHGEFHPLPLKKTHTELTQTYWTRRAIEEEVAQRGFRVDQEGDDFWIYFTNPETGEPWPIDKDIVPWSLLPTGKETPDHYPRVSLLSTNSKMRCPTWDLPAGASDLGGACPASGPAQTTSARSGSHFFPILNAQTGTEERTEVEPEKAVCQYCVTGDTRVLVRSEGLVRIEDLVGREFEVWSGQGWRPTRAVFNGIKPTFRLRSSWGHEVRLTSDHEVLTRDNGKIAAEHLDDDQLLFELPPEHPFPTSAPIALRPATPLHFNAVEQHYPTEWSYDVGLFLGYILGDGSVYRAKNGYDSVSLMSSEQDRDDVDRLAATVAKWCSTTSEVKLITPKPTNFAPAPKPFVQIHWRVKSLVEFVEDCGLNKDVPPEMRRAPSGVWTATRDAVAGFLSGLFSTDGSVSVGAYKAEVSLASVSEPLLRDVQQLLFALGIKSTICEYETSNIERVKQGYRKLYKLGINAAAHIKRFASQVNFFSGRKSRRLEEALLKIEDVQNLNRYPVAQKIEATGLSEPVFDLINVGEEHQFTANCISVSNCYASGSAYKYASTQLAEVTRFQLVQSFLKQDRDAQKRGEVSSAHDDFVNLMVEAIVAAKYPLETKAQPDLSNRFGIKPIRVHSSGDFFSEEYADWWIDIAVKLAVVAPDVRLWAPTRTHVQFIDFWPKALKRIPIMPDGKPNFVIRPSGYHIGEPAPRFIDTEEMPQKSNGTSVLSPADSERHRGEFYDHQCGVYDLAKGSKTCNIAKSPSVENGGDGAPGCRACWVRPDLRINYVVH